jgi:hypothetical protein
MSKKKTKLLNEDSPSSATLQSSGGSGGGIEPVVMCDVLKQALSQMRDLNASQRERFLGIVQQIYRDNYQQNASFGAKLLEPYKSQLPDDTSTKTQNFNDEENDWKTVSEMLADEQFEEELEQIGFNRESKEKLRTIFLQTIEDRVNSLEPLRSVIQEAMSRFVEENGFSPFIDDQQLNVVELLANKIQTLEADLEIVENANAELRDENNNLQEETDGWFAPPTKKSRHSTVGDLLLEPTNDEDVFSNESQGGDPMVRRYLEAFR